MEQITKCKKIKFQYLRYRSPWRSSLRGVPIILEDSLNSTRIMLSTSNNIIKSCNKFGTRLETTKQNNFMVEINFTMK